MVNQSRLPDIKHLKRERSAVGAGSGIETAGSCTLREILHPTPGRYFSKAYPTRDVCSVQILSVSLNQGARSEEAAIARDLTPCQAQKDQSVVRE